MIITLTENTNFKRNFKNFFGIFKSKVDVENKTFKNIKIKNVFINKKVTSSYIKKIVGNDLKVVLCPKNLKLLKNKDFKIYKPSKEFLFNICKNAFFKILDAAKLDPEKLNLAVFDLQGHCVGLLKRLIFYCKNLTVISNNLSVYEKEQNYLLKNYGATFFLSNNLNYLFKEKIIFAPSKIESKLPLKKSSIVFTSEKSNFPLSGTIYKKYKFRKIRSLENIFPKEISREYFLASLYDVYKIKKIKNIEPNLYFDGFKYISWKDLVKKIKFY